MEILKDLQKLVDELKTTNSMNDKKDILAKYPQCKDIIVYTLDPFKQFYVTSKNIKKMEKSPELDTVYSENYDDIFKLLDDLSERKISGYKAIKTVVEFIKQNNNYKDLIYNIIDKDLKCRVAAGVVNKVWPNAVPEFKIALAKKYSDFKHKVDFSKDEWLSSRKLNGVRCLIVKKDNKISFLSRTGKPYFTLDNLIPDIKKLPLKNFVLDGELCIIDENGKDNFQAIMKEIRKKDHQVENPKFMAFDLLDIEEFENGCSRRNLYDRVTALVSVLTNYGSEKLSYVSQTLVKSYDNFKELENESIEKGWEGLILRKNTVYEGKRTNNILKVKQFFDDEFVVKDIEIGPIRHIIEDENGSTKEIESEMMSAAIIEYEGYKVGVGSGWTMEQRLDFYKNPDLIIGKTITVEYFMPSTNQKGGKSLTWPTVKYIHGNEREY
ncbi:MAG: RNA ligase family protein [Candidatus Woesearchaeota archaeon]